MKEILTDAGFRKRLQTNPCGGFLFFGDEDYLKAHALKSARAAVCPDESLAVFNDMIIDCSTDSVSADSLYSSISSALSAAPMMADSKLVTLSGICVDELHQSEIDAICQASALLDEYDFNTFIITVPAGMLDAGNLPKRPSATLTKLAEHLTPVHFEYVGEAKLASWALRHFEHNGVKALEGVTSALLNRCGKNMFNLANEIDKLSFYALGNGRSTVSVDDVELVTSKNEEFDSFALGSAIASGDSELALRILALIKAQKTEPVIVLGELSKTLSDMLSIKLLSSAGVPASDIASAIKVHEYRVKLYIGGVRSISKEKLSFALELCTAADSALKQSQGGYVEIEKLICAL